MGTGAGSEWRDKNHAPMAEVLMIPPGRYDLLEGGIRAAVGEAVKKYRAPWFAARSA